MDDISAIFLNVALYAPFAAVLAIVLFWGIAGAGFARWTALCASVLSCAGSVWVWLSYWLGYGAGGTFAFVCEAPAPFLPIIGVNGVSAPLLAMAGIVGLASTLWALNSPMERKRLYLLLLLVMQGGLMGIFSSLNVLWMYAFHEFALVPTFIAMCIWGGPGKRVAAMEMAVYLTAGALVSLLGIIAFYAQSGATGFSLGDLSAALVGVRMDVHWEIWIFGALLFGLGTLVSLFPLYSWAPRAYAAAPTSFAMLHAGVLKKFGLYLLIQVAAPLIPNGAFDWVWVMAILALFNVLYIGLVAMAQDDLKLMVSYSSVSHMGMCFLGIATLSVAGVGGTVLLMFGHGLSAALLFMLSNAVCNASGEWDMRKMGGMYKDTPVLAGFFVAATFASIGLPGFANFFGELSIFVGLWGFSPAVCAAAALGLVISAVYGLRAVARVFMGEKNPESEYERGADLTWAQRVPAIILLAALVFAGVCPSAVTKGLDSMLSSVPVYNQDK